MHFFHGTAVRYAYSMAAGAALSADVAAGEKIDGPPGFFLATVESDAEFFAARRDPGAVIVVEIEEVALSALESAGARRQPIPVTARSPYFAGDELWIPVQAFGTFDALRARGHIHVHA